MTHWRALIERDYIGAWDLRSKDWVLTIKKVDQQKVYNQKAGALRGRAVITFVEAQKAWIANATNLETIANMYGDNFEQWPGKRITLYPTTTMVAKKSVPCVRVRGKIPTAAPAPLPVTEADPAMRAKQDEAFDREPGVDR